MTAVERVFRPGWWLTLFTALGVMVLAALGFWQLERLTWKRDLITTAETNLALSPIALPADPAAAGDLDFRPVEATGTLRYDKAQVFGLESQGNQTGARLLVPMERAEGPAL